MNLVRQLLMFVAAACWLVLLPNLRGQSTCVEAPAGLVAWWRAESNALDSIFGNHGTLQNGVTFTSGEVGQAFQFDGIASGVAIGNPANLRLQDFSIEAWVKRSRLDAGGGGPSREGAVVAGGHDGYAFGLLADGQLFLSKVDVNFVSSGAALRVTDTAFHHIAVTKSGTSVTFYVDGIGGAPVSYSAVFAFTKSISIGARLDLSPPTSSPNNTATFAGAIDEVGIFDRALTSDKVQEIFDAGSVGKCLPLSPQCSPAPAGLVAWWQAERAATDTVSFHHGTLNGGMSFTSGKVRQAFKFDGIDDYISVPHSDVFNPTGPFSVEVWIKASPQQTSPDRQWVIVDTEHGFVDGTGWLLQGNPNGSIAFGFGKGGNSGAPQNFLGTSTTSSLLDDQWHHIAGVFTGTSIEIYQDGALQSTQNATNTPVGNARNLVIGRAWGGGTPTRYFSGLIDEVSYYDRALGADEVQAIFDADSAGKCSLCTIICPPIILTNVSRGQTDVLVTYTPPMITGGCTGTVVTCTPPSGSRFPIGFNLVTCMAEDVGSGMEPCFFAVIVLPNFDDDCFGIPDVTTVYNLSDGWSNTNNPFGPWTLWKSPTERFTINQNDYDGSGQSAWADEPFPQLRHVPAWQRYTVGGLTGAAAPGDILVHGAELDRTGSDYTSVKWTAPAAGSAQLVGKVWAVTTFGRSQKYVLRKNGIDLSETAITSDGSHPVSNPVVFEQFSGGPDVTSQLVKAGDELELAVISLSENGNLGDFAGISFEIRFTACVPRALAPLIVQEPEDQTLAAGSDVVLQVDAMPQPLMFQWKRNGVNLTNETNATLVLSRVAASDGGGYSVAVANDFDAIESRIASVTIDSAALAFADDFESAGLLTQISGAGSGDNTGATRQPGEPLHAGKRGANSVWINWLAPQNGIVTFTTAGSGFDTLLAAYSGTSLSALTQLDADDDSAGFNNSRVSFRASAGVTYHIAVDGLSGSQGPIVLSWQFEATLDPVPFIITQPASQIVRVGDPVQFSVTGGANPVGATLQYQWFFDDQPIAGANQNRFDLPATSVTNVGRYNVRLSVNSRFVDSQDALLQLVQNNPAEAGLASGKFADVVDAARPPIVPLKSRSDGKAVARGFTATQIFSTVGETKEPGEPNHCGVIGGASVWNAFQAPADGSLLIDTDGSSFDTVLAIYTGPGDSFATLAPVACDNDSGTDRRDSKTRFTVTEGTLYWIAVDGVGGARGKVVLNWNLLRPLQLRSPAQTSNGVRFTVAGNSNITFYIQSSTDLVNWQTLLTTNSATGLFNFTNSTSGSPRFFRAVHPF